MKQIQVRHQDLSESFFEGDLQHLDVEMGTGFVLWQGQRVDYAFDGNDLYFCVQGIQYHFEVLTEAESRRVRLLKSARSGSGLVKAPMPGKVLQISVQEGDQVAIDTPVAVVEAMKMQNEYKAGVDGVVKSVHVLKGDTVEAGNILVEIEVV